MPVAPLVIERQGHEFENPLKIKYPICQKLVVRSDSINSDKGTKLKENQSF